MDGHPEPRRQRQHRHQPVPNRSRQPDRLPRKRHRQHLSPLSPPVDASPRPAHRRPEHERRWLRAISSVAADREQFAVPSDDPSQPLGPYAESGTQAHKPYWHAAESLLAARRLAGLDAPASASTPDSRARAQVAADIYRALTDAPR